METLKTIALNSAPFLLELTGAPPKGVEGMSAYVPPGYVWEAGGRLDNQQESSPCSCLALPSIHWSSNK